MHSSGLSRVLARNIGLESALSERKPFPGPGLFIRVVGTPVTVESIEKVRLADHIVTEILKKEEFYKDVSQLVVALLGSKTVGVQGDSRSYEYPIVVRVVSSTDFIFSPPYTSRLLKPTICSNVTPLDGWITENDRILSICDAIVS